MITPQLPKPVLLLLCILSTCLATSPEGCCLDYDDPVIDTDCSIWFTGCAYCEVENGIMIDNRTECQPTSGSRPSCCAYPYEYCQDDVTRSSNGVPGRNPPRALTPFCKECEEVDGYELLSFLGASGGECSDGASFDSCSAACDDDENCIAFDYLYTSESCCIWEEVIMGLDPWKGICTYVSYTADCPAVSNYDLYENLGRNGGDCYETNSLSMCDDDCRDADDCTGFDWIEPNMCCTWNEALQALKVWPGICTYINYGDRACPRLSNFDVSEDLGKDGGRCFDSQFNSCIADCMRDDDCVAFDWIYGSCCIWDESPTELQLWPAICTYTLRQ